MVNLNQLVAVVDDDESIVRAVKRLLRSVGIEAETFSTGEEFLGRLSSTASYRPACVILDFQMPGIDGLELQRRLALTRMPVIFITGHDDTTIREKALAAGAAGYLQKPFDGASLVKVVKLALDAKPVPIERFTQ